MEPEQVTRRPRWWQLYAVLPLSIALLWGQSQLDLLPGMHKLLDIGILVLAFGWMAVWVHVNRSPIQSEEHPQIVFVSSIGPSDDLDFELPVSVAPAPRSLSSGSLGETEPTTLKGRFN